MLAIDDPGNPLELAFVGSGCRVLFGEFQSHVVDNLFEIFFRRVFQQSIIAAIQRLFIADRPLGGDIENVRVGKRFDEDFEPAVEIPINAGVQIDVVPGNARAPAFFVHHGGKIEAWKVIAETSQAAFDVFAECQAEFRVQIAQVIFGCDSLTFCLSLIFASFLTAIDGSL